MITDGIVDLPKAFGRCHWFGGGVLQTGAVIAGDAVPALPDIGLPAATRTGRLTLALSERCAASPIGARLWRRVIFGSPRRPFVGNKKRYANIKRFSMSRFLFPTQQNLSKSLYEN
jgi:hypothetical protein